MRVQIDVDGVLADFTLAFTHLAAEWELTDYSWPTTEQDSWDFNFDTEFVWKVVKDSYNWWMLLVPLVTPEEVNKLNEVIEKHDVYFVTNRPSTKGLSAEMQTRYWLSSIGVLVDHASVIATKVGTKGKLAAALNIDIAIDDKPENIMEISAENITCVVRAWKYNEKLPHKRVYSLKQFLEEYLGEQR